LSHRSRCPLRRSSGHCQRHLQHPIRRGHPHCQRLASQPYRRRWATRLP